MLVLLGECDPELPGQHFEPEAMIESIATKMSFFVSGYTALAHTPPSTLYAPGATGYIQLAAANGIWLVDTSSRITGDGVTQTGWDRFEVGDLSVGVHTLAVTAGGGAPVTLPFEVAIPDSIAGGRGVLVQGEPSLVCFVALRGTIPVHAAFEVYASAEASIERTNYDGCVSVTRLDARVRRQ